MNNGGKGSAPRPFSVTKEKFEENWNKVLNKDLDNTDTKKNEYYDQLSTEDCFPDDISDL